MPIPNPPSRNQQDGHQGPIDGVKPVDHPEIYWTLLNSQCLKAGNLRIYVHEAGGRACEACFLAQPPEDQEDFEEGGSHTLVHNNVADFYKQCLFCDHIIMQSQNASECTECIEEYLEIDPQRLNNGEPINVVQHW